MDHPFRTLKNVFKNRMYLLGRDKAAYGIYGMRRSGNHAIIEWILSDYYVAVHENDIDPITGKPESTWYKIGENYIKGFLPWHLESECNVKSYEDQVPTDVKFNTIIILRDWYNVCASRFISGRGWQTSCRNELCPEVYTNFCRTYKKFPDNFILYNFWVNDKKYRKKLELKYGLKNALTIDTVPKTGIGSGSSFDGDDLNKDKVNTRYKRIREEFPEEWNRIIRYSEINGYMMEIFGIDIEK